MKFMNIYGFLMGAKGEGEGGGGSGGGKGAEGGKGEGEGGKGQGSDDMKAVLARLDAYEKEIKELKAGKQKPQEEDPDLIDKARKEREAKDKGKADTKALESALKFNLGAKDWLKTNASLLPKDVEGVFNAAEKETYDSAIEKDSAIKSGVMQAFFDVQANLDLLTASQKTVLEEWRKLTKTGKQEKAQGLYEQIFEPTFEMLKRLEKAKQLGKDGQQTETSDVEAAYRDRMMKLSKKHYLGEKDA